MAFGACCDILAGAQTQGSSSSSVGSVARAPRKGDHRDATRRTRRRRGEMQNAVHDAVRRELDAFRRERDAARRELIELQAAASLAIRAYVLRADAARQKCLARIRLAADESNVTAALDEMSEALQHAEAESLRMVVAACAPAAASSRQVEAALLALRDAVSAADMRKQIRSAGRGLATQEPLGVCAGGRVPLTHSAAADAEGSDDRRATDQYGHAQFGPRAAAGAAGGTAPRPQRPGPRLARTAARLARTAHALAQLRQESGRRPAEAPRRCRRAGAAGWPAMTSAPPGAPYATSCRHGAARRSGCDWAMQIGRSRCLPHGRGPAASWARAEGRAGGRRRPHNPPGRPPGPCKG